MVAGNAIQTGCIQRRAAEQITAADDQSDLYANTNQLADLERQLVQDFGINTEGFLTG